MKSLRLGVSLIGLVVILVLQGMSYLHSCEVSVHGKLRSCNCLIDGRFVLKISDFGLTTLTSPMQVEKDSDFYKSTSL